MTAQPEMVPLHHGLVAIIIPRTEDDPRPRKRPAATTPRGARIVRGADRARRARGAQP